MDTNPAPMHIAGTFSIVVASLVVGGLIVAFADPYLPASLSNTQKGYQIGFAAARKIAENSRYGDSFRTPTDIRYISGPVTAIQGNRLTVRMQSLNPFDNLVAEDKTVIIATTTNIIKFVAKDPVAYQKELAAWNASAASKVAGAVAPSPSAPVAVDGKSITVGTIIVAIATENIKDAKEFTASQIQVQPKLLLGK